MQLQAAGGVNAGSLCIAKAQLADAAPLLARAERALRSSSCAGAESEGLQLQVLTCNGSDPLPKVLHSPSQP